MDEISFGQIVRERRDSLGLTQAELARRVGCATITVRKTEANDIRPSVQIAERLAESLGVPQAEQRAFVRLARTEKPVMPIPAPSPELSEIGSGDLSGRAIRGYQLGERIGKGGFGVVYRAVQPSVQRDVAIKIVLPRFANHPEFIRRFESEARLVASLEHPHIVPLYDYWREPNIASLIMRFLKGGSLEDRLAKTGPLDLEEAGAVLEQVGAALHRAHESGIVHRDVKPANILLDDSGNAYLSDFGIAKNVALASGDTADGDLVGSPHYFAPEQLLSDPLRPQTDIYSLGLVLYELLTGRKPFAGPQLVDFIQQQLHQEVPPLGNGANGFPPGLDAVLARATAKEPAARFPDVASLVTAYQQTVTPISARRWHVPVAEPAENPFKGLRPFGEADAADFFGRGTLVQDLLTHLGQENDLARFLAVVGSSGSGKSSVVRAGLLPALRRGGLPTSEKWFITDMIPGGDPFRELERALLRVAIHTPGEWLDHLRRERTGLLQLAEALLPDDGETELLLVVDQFEELFTQVEDEATRALFLDSLTTAVLSPESRLRLIITLRADFTDRPLQYVDFGELVRQRAVFVLPLTPDEVEEAITRPVQRLGLGVEPELTATIIHDVGNQPGALPLLQYALTELFEQREEGTLTLQAYQENGGVSGALARRADQIYQEMAPAAQVASRQLFLRLVTLGEGAEVRRFEGHTDTVFASVFSPDGRYLASAGQDNTLRLWETESGDEVRQFRGHTDWIGEVDFSPDGRYLLTGSADRTARIWDVESGLELRRLVGHTDEVFTAQFSPDGRLIATGSRDKTARLWDTATGRELRQILGHTGAVFADFSPDGSLLVTSSEDRTGRLWDVMLASEPQTVIGPAGGHSVNHTAAAISTDGQRVLTDQGDGAIRLWHTPTSELIGQIPLQEDSANSLAFSPDGSLALAGSSNGAAYLIRAHSGQEANRFVGHEGNVWAAIFSPDGRLALTGGDDGTARLWEAMTGREVRQFVGHTGPVRSVAFSPDGRQILSGSDDQTMILWQAESGEDVGRFGDQNGAVLALAFAPDGQSVASGHDDGTAVLWDAETGQALQRFVGHTDQVSQVVFSPDGQYVLTGSADQTARLWDAHTGQLLHQYVGHESPLLTVGFSEDGRQVYTADSGNVYAWRTTLADVIGYACEQLSRDFTAEERVFYNIEDNDQTCPDWPEQVVQVEPTWTPIALVTVDAAPLSLAVETELAGDSADVSISGEPLTIMVEDISDTSNFTPVADSRAHLLTDDQGATIQVHTSGLTPGHAVTLWLVFFNNPENCSDGECGPDDAFPPPGNPAVGASVMYGTGQVIGGNGQAYFGAHASVGRDAAPWPVGLLNPRTAEIHFILRDHGPAIPGLIYEQITTPGAGCNNFPPHTGDYTCVDVQAGFFRQQ